MLLREGTPADWRDYLTDRPDAARSLIGLALLQPHTGLIRLVLTEFPHLLRCAESAKCDRRCFLRIRALL